MKVARPEFYFRIFAFAALSVLGIYALVGITLQSYDLVVEESHGSWPFNSRPAKATLIIFQTFLLVAVLIGGRGAWRDERNSYFWATLILLGVSIILTIFGVVTVRASMTNFEMKIRQDLEKGKWSDFDWFDSVQENHKCCGVDSYLNWERINGKVNPDGTGKGYKLNKNSLPSSCCKKSGCGHNILLEKEYANFTSQIYVKPCGPEIIPPVRKALVTLGIEMLVVAIVSLSVCIFLYGGATEMFCCLKQRDARGARRSDGDATTSIYLESDQEGEDDDACVALTDEERAGVEAQKGGKTKRRVSRDKHVGIDSKGNILVGDAKPRSKSGGVVSHRQQHVAQVRQQQQKRKYFFGKQQLPAGVTGGVVGEETSRSKGRSKRARLRGDDVVGRSLTTNGNTKKSRKAALHQGNMLNNNVQKMNRNQNSSPSRNNNNGTKSDMILQKLEMLYEGLDKNVSTLSTTPNPSGSLFFPWSNNCTTTTTSTPPPPPPINTRLAGNKGVKGIPLSHCSSVPHLPHNMRHQTHYPTSYFVTPPSNKIVTTKPPLPHPLRQIDQDTLTSSATNDAAQRFPDFSIAPQPQLAEDSSIPPNPEIDINFSPPQTNLDVESPPTTSTSVTLNIPPDVAPIPVEATNAINLIHEHDTELDVVSLPPPVVVYYSDQISSVPPMYNSSSSLGFENSSSTTSSGSAGGGESVVEQSDDEEWAAMDGDNVPTARKSKVRFLTLPTIVEEPEPTSPKKESPAASITLLNETLLVDQ